MTLAGFLIAPVVYLLVFCLHLIVPAREVDGYVISPATGRPYRYRLNGLIVYWITVALWAACCASGLLAWDALWTFRWESLAGACVTGLVFTSWIVLTAPATGKGLLADLFLGRLENPQWLNGRVDAKMYLYLVGATMLGLNIYSFALHHIIASPDDVSNGVLLYAALFTFFLSEYLFFERVHLYTYDFFAERVGFKLGWGCLLFYPYFYSVGLWSVADQPNPHASSALLVLSVILFFSGWCFARGANMQKYVFKRDPSAIFLGVIKPVVLRDGDKQLLASGFWGIARHVNYLGELLMATGLTLSLGYPEQFMPWLYPLYYVVLLVPRQIDDDRRCAQKYGALWDAYMKRVPYRIIPGVY